MKATVTYIFLLVVATTAQNYCNTNNTVYETILDGVIYGSPIMINSSVSFITTISEDFSFWLWRTEDGGKTWISQTPFLTNINNFDASPKKLRVYGGGIYRVVQAPSNPLWIYLIGNNGNFWTTTNGGQTYNYYNLPYEFVDVIPHPLKEDWVLGLHYDENCWISSNLSSTACIYKRSDVFSFYNTKLSLSQDGGRTWRFIKNHVVEVSWGEAGINGTSNETIYVMGNRILPINSSQIVDPMSLIKTTNFFANQTYLLEAITSFIFEKESSTIFTVLSPSEDKHRIMTSSDYGKTFNLPIGFPEINPAYYDIFILDVSVGSVFVGVQNKEEENILDNIDVYTSDLLNGSFSLSLKDVTLNGSYAFQKLSGLPGYYFSNHINGSGVQSVITFDSGRTWFPLASPKDESCDNCTLNLLGTSNGFGIDTAEKSLGIIVGAGNVGKYLDNSLSGSNMYISKDAGVTWGRFYNGTWLFDLSDNGEQIYLLDKLNPTNSMVYTEDLGKTWVNCLFVGPSNRTHTVYHISSSLAGRKSSAWIATKWTNNTIQTSSLFYVEFSLPPCNSNQYEKFNPSGPFEDDCYLGSNIIYTRKIPGEKCEPDPKVLEVTENRICNCTMKDYACSECHTLYFNQCVYKPDSDNSKCNYSCDGYFPQKYRRVNGTVCVNDLEILNQRDKVVCLGDYGPMTTGDIIGLAIGCVLVGGTILAFVIYLIRRSGKKTHEEQKDEIELDDK